MQKTRACANRHRTGRDGGILILYDIYKTAPRATGHCTTAVQRFAPPSSVSNKHAKNIHNNNIKCTKTKRNKITTEKRFLSLPCRPSVRPCSPRQKLKSFFFPPHQNSIIEPRYNTNELRFSLFSCFFSVGFWQVFTCLPDILLRFYFPKAFFIFVVAFILIRKMYGNNGFVILDFFIFIVTRLKIILGTQTFWPLLN